MMVDIHRDKISFKSSLTCTTNNVLGRVVSLGYYKR